MKDCGSGSSVGIVTEYGPDYPGIESPWERLFSHQFRLTLGPSQPPAQSVPYLSGRKRGNGVPHARTIGTVRLLYSP
jgi:hypothetical protein